MCACWALMMLWWFCLMLSLMMTMVDDGRCWSMLDLSVRFGHSISQCSRLFHEEFRWLSNWSALQILQFLCQFNLTHDPNFTWLSSLFVFIFGVNLKATTVFVSMFLCSTFILIYKKYKKNVKLLWFKMIFNKSFAMQIPLDFQCFSNLIYFPFRINIF